MPYVPATCPSCGADLSVDTTQEKGYCSHCGGMIDFQSAIQSAIFSNPIEFEGYESYSTLVGMIEEDLRNGRNQTPEFRDKLNRAIELNPDDVYLYSLVESEIWNARIENNVLIQYEGTAKKVVVPEGIEIIDQLAFGRHMQLLEITLPKSIMQIRTGAFLYESSLIINAYAGSYGAKYAMSSPAKLKLIDKIQGGNPVEEIESILREFDSFKKATASNLEIYFNKAFSTKWWLVFLVLLPAIYAIFMTFRGYIVYSGLALFGILYIVFTLFITAVMSGYNEIKCQVSYKRQIALFMKKCNDILNPLGVTDFEYRNNIFDDSYDELETKLAKLKKTRNRVIGQDLSEIYKKPKLYYSFLDYIQGRRPSDYNNE